ncbi:MAG: glycerophosphodiester phosphodiesterase [Phycisphaerales bacterium]
MTRRGSQRFRSARTFVLLVAVVSLCSCTTSQHDPLPLIVAHRGASHIAPENTLAAFRLAWVLDADLIEGDFYLTSDGVIVAHHDDTTKRTAKVDRLVQDQTLQELTSLDVGSWKDSKWAGQKIPTLNQVFGTVPPHGKILIEIKSDTRIVEPLIDVVRDSPLAKEQMIIICFDAQVIAQIKQRLPSIRAYWLSDFEEHGIGRWDPTVDQIIETAKRIGAEGVDLKANLNVIDAKFVAEIQRAGLELHVWTVNDPVAARRLMKLGVDSITTDRPGWLRSQLQRRR